MTTKDVEEAWNKAIQSAANIARSNGAYGTYYDILKLKKALSTATNKP
jgi:hypothetical protein